MIAGSRMTEQPFEVGQGGVLPIYLFDFEFSKALKDRPILHDGHVVECDLCNRGMVSAHTNTCSPDTQGRYRHEVPVSEMENEQITEHCRRHRMAIDQLKFLPVLHQRELQLPSLFSALDPMTQGDPSMG